MLQRFALGYVVDVVSAAVLWLPLFAVLDIFLDRGMKAGRKLGYLALAVYLSAVFSIVGIPGITSVTLDWTINWIPVLDIRNNPVRYMEISLLNILLFLPLGVLLPLMWEEFRPVKRTALFGFGLSLGIEVMQIFTFRVSDVDDLIMNTLGTAAGYAITYVWAGKHKYRRLHMQKGGVIPELAVLVAVVFLAVFFVRPYISDAIWELIL